MSSYEDIYEMASTFLEALKNIHWRSPNIESLIDPVSEQLLLTISDSQNLVANPTLAAPTNVRAFLSSVFSSVQDTNNLITFIAFLIAVPLFSTFLVAMLTNVNIVLKALRLPLVRNPISASPLAVILLMVTIFGNIPLVTFFPARANQVQAFLPVQPGHYHGAIARVMQIVAFYEQVQLGTCVALQFAHIARHRRVQLVRLFQPTSIIDWSLSIFGFALRMWFTRVSTDTATSPVQSGSTIWVWRKVILRTDARYQTSDELNDDVFVWMAYFVTMFCFSSLVVKYALSSKQEGYQSVETKVIKVTPTSTVYSTSVGCQTTVTGDDWIPKSHVATDLVRVAEIEAVIDSDIKAITVESVNSVRAAQSVAENIKQDTLRWQNDHTALNTHISALKEFRKTLERHEEDGLKQRELADKVSATVKRLEALIKKQAKNHEEKFQACEKAFRARIEGLLEQIATLEKDSGEQTGNDGKNKASEVC
ncbi:hypothetical protein M408DRAFT_174776 [Serendipita vermifera MAFF 305830]|uniref:Uncharacterized protein n=1 Tax=Serendipita vermifera MAFF 305830 TaxID=933852 RepID=A0A0C3B3U7_SERVB|nr:hypothetical protein M408DRAFT_174776 [Serendipita vermifera MAFF 305830]